MVGFKISSLVFIMRKNFNMSKRTKKQKDMFDLYYLANYIQKQHDYAINVAAFFQEYV